VLPVRTAWSAPTYLAGWPSLSAALSS
jgi:hypothetical protein